MAARTVTVAAACAVSATGTSGSGGAAPRPTPEQVRRHADLLFQQAEAARQRHSGAKDRVDRARRGPDGVRDRPALRTAQGEAARDRPGAPTAERYRTGGEAPALRLVLTSSPQFPERSQMLERAGAVKAAPPNRPVVRQAARAAARDAASPALTGLEAAQRERDGEHPGGERRLTEAEDLMAAVSARQRRRIEAADPAGTAAPGAHPAAAPVPGGGTAADPRAAQAVAFACAQIGKPCVWGATGPSAYDCSGLTRAAWAAAGVPLPRTTYRQINAGTRVAESRLRPGDLVFYYAGVTHVAIYVGGGLVVHAPHPGATVRLAPVGGMPFVGAARPA